MARESDRWIPGSEIPEYAVVRRADGVLIARFRDCASYVKSPHDTVIRTHVHMGGAWDWTCAYRDDDLVQVVLRFDAQTTNDELLAALAVALKPRPDVGDWTLLADVPDHTIVRSALGGVAAVFKGRGTWLRSAEGESRNSTYGGVWAVASGIGGPRALIVAHFDPAIHHDIAAVLAVAHEALASELLVDRWAQRGEDKR